MTPVSATPASSEPFMLSGRPRTCLSSSLGRPNRLNVLLFDPLTSPDTFSPLPGIFLLLLLLLRSPLLPPLKSFHTCITTMDAATAAAATVIQPGRMASGEWMCRTWDCRVAKESWLAWDEELVDLGAFQDGLEISLVVADCCCWSLLESASLVSLEGARLKERCSFNKGTVEVKLIAWALLAQATSLDFTRAKRLLPNIFSATLPLLNPSTLVKSRIGR